MKTRLTGPLGKFMKRHLELRRSLGYELRTAEIALDQFDAYAAEYFPNCQTVTRPMITGYLLKISDLHPVTRHGQLSVLRQFCRFLFQLDSLAYIPEGHLLPAAKADFQPHIYTLREVVQLMDAARRLPPTGSLRPHTYSTLIMGVRAAGRRTDPFEPGRRGPRKGHPSYSPDQEFQVSAGSVDRQREGSPAGLPRSPYPAWH